MISTDTLNAVGIMLGSQEAEALYIGNNLIWLQSSPLPYDAEVEYLESTGTQFINTDYQIWNYGLSGEIKMQRTGDSTGEKAYIGRSAQGGFDLYIKSGSGIGLWLDAGSNIDLTSSNDYFDKNIHVVLFEIRNNGSTLNVDGNSYSTTHSYRDNSKSFIQLFSHRGYYNSEGRIYYCKLWDNGIMIYDLIPVRVGQVGYMYDKITRLLFGNAGSGDFVLGADKLPNSYTKLQYISSTSDGSLYIDLGVKLYETLNTNYDIAMKFNFKGNGSDNLLPTLFGCLNQTDPWPGTFIRISSSGATQITGRYIGKNTKDNNLGSKNSIIELPVQTSPNKNVYNLNNSGLTHNWSTSLFCAFDSNLSTPFRFAEADLYYFKLFVEGVLVRDMVPCKNSSNVVGLYDLVERVFYTSPNNAIFVAGPVEVN